MEHLLVISPHLDDGVFSCGALLDAHPGAVLATVFAGTPHPCCSTPWDRACGFRGSDEAMRARRLEDLKALVRLRARPLWLSFLDSQYRAHGQRQENSPAAAQPDCDALQITAAISAALVGIISACAPDTVLFPFGLFHGDHDCVHRACLRLIDVFPQLRWLAYADALYRDMPGLLQQRLVKLQYEGRIATPVFPLSASRCDPKRLAVLSYQSQWRALGSGNLPDTDAPEQYWSVS